MWGGGYIKSDCMKAMLSDYALTYGMSYIRAHVEIHILMHVNIHVDNPVGGCTKNE